MRRELISSALAIVALTLLLGLAYPLTVTGVARLAFPTKSGGSRLEHGGMVVGSRLIGQDFRGTPRYFQSRPSATGYAADATAFGNLGPNSSELAHALKRNLAAYLKRERPYDPRLEPREAPPDAVQASGSGVDPHISEANARIQARRVAAQRGLRLEHVLALIKQHTDGRTLGLLGEPGVNVLELNMALDAEWS
jgi:potassium-transporting ATPase KdpC subunit